MNKYIVLTTILIVIINLIIEKIKPSITFFLATIVLLIFNCVTIDTFLSSFSNPSIVAIFLLIIITGCIKDNFGIYKLFDKIFRTKNVKLFMLKMMAFSTFFHPL